MTFLNPLALFGLVAAAIPVLLHLLNLRKLRVIEFSTLAFLKELQQTKIRRLKLRQIILLIIRTLLIAVIILAFARPALRGTLGPGFGTRARTTMVLILDDSFSMTASDEKGTYFRQAKENALRILDLPGEGDDVILLKLSDLPAATVAPATHDIGLVRSAVSEASISAVRRPLDAALTAASALLKQSHNPNQEIYILSDCQQTLFSQHPPAAFGGGPVSMFTVPIGSSVPSDAAIDSVAVISTIPELHKPVTIRAWIRNSGAVPLKNYVVSAYVDRTRAAQTSAGIPAWGTSVVDMNILPSRAGTVEGRCELESDAIDADNSRMFTLEIPGQLAVALAGASDSDMAFLAAAMGAGSDSSLFRLKNVPAGQLSFLDFSGLDVLVCSGIPEFSPALTEKIRSFVERGGGLILFPGPSTNIKNYNTTLLPALGFQPVRDLGQSAPPQSPAVFSRADLDHPLFASLFEEQRTDKKEQYVTGASPQVTTWIRRAAGRLEQTIIALSGGDPFLSERKIGSGRVLLYAVAPTLNWSDFPLKAIYPPLIHRSVMYAGSRGESSEMYRAGDAPLISVGTTPAIRSAPGRYRLLSPDSTEEMIQPAAGTPASGTATPSITFQLRRLPLTGFYRIMKGDMLLKTIPVNTDPAEADTRKISAEAAGAFWQAAGIDPSRVRALKTGEQIQASVLENRFGTELWKHAIALALLLAAAEMLIARNSRRDSPPGSNA